VQKGGEKVLRQWAKVVDSGVSVWINAIPEVPALGPPNALADARAAAEAEGLNWCQAGDAKERLLAQQQLDEQKANASGSQAVFQETRTNTKTGAKESTVNTPQPKQKAKVEETDWSDDEDPPLSLAGLSLAGYY
jgi:hypothetical protein